MLITDNSKQLSHVTAPTLQCNIINHGSLAVQEEEKKKKEKEKAVCWTHWERLLPAGSHYGGSDDANVELILLLLHHVLRQGFGVGVGVGPVADEPRCDVPHDAIIHPPEVGRRDQSEK